jgi:hypothetical protein
MEYLVSYGFYVVNVLYFQAKGIFSCVNPRVRAHSIRKDLHVVLEDLDFLTPLFSFFVNYDMPRESILHPLCGNLEKTLTETLTETWTETWTEHV